MNTKEKCTNCGGYMVDTGRRVRSDRVMKHTNKKVGLKCEKNWMNEHLYFRGS